MKNNNINLNENINQEVVYDPDLVNDIDNKIEKYFISSKTKKNQNMENSTVLRFMSFMMIIQNMKKQRQFRIILKNFLNNNMELQLIFINIKTIKFEFIFIVRLKEESI